VLLILCCNISESIISSCGKDTLESEKELVGFKGLAEDGLLFVEINVLFILWCKTVLADYGLLIILVDRLFVKKMLCLVFLIELISLMLLFYLIYISSILLLIFKDFSGIFFSHSSIILYLLFTDTSPDASNFFSSSFIILLWLLLWSFSHVYIFDGESYYFLNLLDKATSFSERGEIVSISIVF